MKIFQNVVLLFPVSGQETADDDDYDDIDDRIARDVAGKLLKK